MITTIGTYLPAWAGAAGGRQAGADEDAVTLAVTAGRAALDDRADAARDLVARVVLVSRDLPLLEGGNSAALLAGLGLPATLDVVERVGGPPAALDALATAAEGTLVVAADATGLAGAAAALVGAAGGELQTAGRVQRSLPLRVRSQDGSVHEDDDPRLMRERGLRAALDLADLPGKPVTIAGVRPREAAAFCEGPPIDLPTTGASAALFALAALADQGASGLVAAVEQATLAAATWDPTGTAVERVEPAPHELPELRAAPGPDIKLAFTAYERAFDAKLRFLAGRCPTCGTLAFPERHRCLGCGAEGTAELHPLPRTGTVYTTTTIHVPVPGLASPYSLAVVQLDGVDVRALVHVTDARPGTVDIDAPGRMVFRRVAVRSGVPDYGYAFAPEVQA
jgi:uncharacterized OB-fold protein